MNFIDYCYTAFYCVFYEGLPIGRKSQAVGYASMIIGLPIGGLLGILIKFFMIAIKRPLPSTKAVEYSFALIALISSGIFSSYYSNDDRSSRLYDEYKARHKVMPKGVCIIIGILLITAPFFVLGFL